MLAASLPFFADLHTRFVTSWTCLQVSGKRRFYEIIKYPDNSAEVSFLDTKSPESFVFWEFKMLVCMQFPSLQNMLVVNVDFQIFLLY